MLYQPHQIALWPRLLKAAEIDTVLQTALRELMERGAALRLSEAGYLNLGPGDMPEADYNAVRAAKLQPRGPKMQTVLTNARTMMHPWLLSFHQAYKALNGRCTDGTRALTKTVVMGKPDEWRRLAPLVLDRYYQAMLIGRTLCDAGNAGFFKEISTWLDKIANLEETMKKAGLTLPPWDMGRTWPVETPDGWVWVTDVRDTAPVAVDKLHAPEPNELVLMNYELGFAMAPIEVTVAREAS
jgi:hypothetical protein